jgi:hypothetical protein
MALVTVAVKQCVVLQGYRQSTVVINRVKGVSPADLNELMPERMLSEVGCLIR